MNLNHLAIFHSVAEQGSITRGAQKLLVSQPAVSKQIKELERALAVQLFERRTKPLALTESGRVLAGYARRIFSLADEAQRAVDGVRHLRGGRLAVGASTTVGVYLLPDVMVQFRRRFPGIDMRLEVENGEILRQRLEDELLDVGLTEATIQSDVLDAIEFMRDPYVAIVPPHHQLVRHRGITLDQFCAAGLIVRDVGGDARSSVERALESRGIVMRPSLKLSSTEAIKHAVAAGLGVAIVPRLAIGLELSARQVMQVRVKDLAISRSIFAYSLKNRTRSKSQEALMCLVRHAARGTLARLIKRK